MLIPVVYIWPGFSLQAPSLVQNVWLMCYLFPLLIGGFIEVNMEKTVGQD